MSYTVDAVDKAMLLLSVVAEQSGLGVSELARRSGITKARTYRLLETLEKNGLIRRDGAAATYSLGYQSLYLGAAAREQLAVARLARKYLSEIGARCNEDLIVRIRDGIESICVAGWNSEQVLKVQTRVGSRRPLYAGASGKLLLAYAPAEVQERVVNGELCRFTSNTFTEPAELQRQLELIRARGYSESISEFATETVSFAVPLRDVTGCVIATLGLTCPSYRVSPSRHQELIEILKIGARAFSTELGYGERISQIGTSLNPQYE